MPPIIQRELSIAARQPSLFRARVIAAAVGVAMGCFGMLGNVTSSSGKSLFLWMVALAMLASLIEGLRKAASCIAEEREEGTLGLLFLTDLRGHDVILGKLSAIAIRSFHGLLAFFPVLAISVLLGGVTSGELVRVAGILISALLLSLCTGIFASVFSPTSGRAAIYTILLLSGLCLLGPLGTSLTALTNWHFFSTISLISPVRLAVLATQLAYSSQTWDFWLGLFMQFFLAVALLGLSSWLLPRRIQEQPAGSGILPKWLQKGLSIPAIKAADAKTSAALLDKNPLQWLAWKNRENRTAARFLALIILTIGGLMIPFAWEATPGWAFLAALGLRLWAMYLGVSVGYGLKQHGSMELLLVTPLNGQEYIKTLHHGVWRIMAIPLAALTVMTFSWALFGVSRHGESWIGTSGIFYLGWVSLSMGSAAGTGLWSGFADKSIGRAFIMTLIRCMLPVFICCWGIVLGDIFWLAYSIRRIPEEFRKRILDHYTGGATVAGTLALPRGSGPPPIIIK